MRLFALGLEHNSIKFGKVLSICTKTKTEIPSDFQPRSTCIQTIMSLGQSFLNEVTPEKAVVFKVTSGNVEVTHRGDRLWGGVCS